MSPEQVCALVGNAYGRVDAQLLFYKELTSPIESFEISSSSSGNHVCFCWNPAVAANVNFMGP